MYMIFSLRQKQVEHDESAPSITMVTVVKLEVIKDDLKNRKMQGVKLPLCLSVVQVV